MEYKILAGKLDYIVRLNTKESVEPGGTNL